MRPLVKLLAVLPALAVLSGFGPRGAAQGSNYAADREAMVRQLKARGITDARVLAAMSRVPREEFVPAKSRNRAYADMDLTIEEGQVLPRPYLIALMTQELRLKPNERVLEVGTGSGYHAAVLSQITDQVFTIEIRKRLARTAKTRLRRLGYRHVKVRCGDGYQGWAEHQPYDAIIVSCSPTAVPPPLIQQLRVGSRMLIPLRDERGKEYLTRLEKQSSNQLRSTAVIEVKFGPMVSEQELK